MNDQQLGLFLESWLKDSDSPPSDVGRSTAQIEERLEEARQLSRWWPLPAPAHAPTAAAGHTPAGGFSMSSAFKLIAAAGIVALFGGLLLAGLPTTQQEQAVLPATMSGDPAFPTGLFESAEDGLTLELRTDGTCQRVDVPCTYGVNGRYFSEMAFEDPSGAQVPATYRWNFDGEGLTFELWGVEKRPDRQDFYLNHVFRPLGDTTPLPFTDSGFPTGRFVNADGSGSPALQFRSDGRYTTSSGGSASYTVSGDLWTEAVFTPGASGIELVPATYRWTWDGARLQFSLWGEDTNRWRTADLLGRVFIEDKEANTSAAKRVLHLSDPRLDFWVTVELSKGDDGRHVATATIDEEPLGEGVGDTAQEATRAALQALGEPYASDLAKHVKR